MIMIKETNESDLRDYRKAGYAFGVRTMYSGYVDLFCFESRKQCESWLKEFIDIYNYYSDEDTIDTYEPESLDIAYADHMQGTYESCQHMAKDFYEEIDYRRNIIKYKGNNVYIDNFNDKYYIVINYNNWIYI